MSCVFRFHVIGFGDISKFLGNPERNNKIYFSSVRGPTGGRVSLSVWQLTDRVLAGPKKQDNEIVIPVVYSVREPVAG